MVGREKVGAQIAAFNPNLVPSNTILTSESPLGTVK
jgi:hypothetical protein